MTTLLLDISNYLLGIGFQELENDTDCYVLNGCDICIYLYYGNSIFSKKIFLELHHYREDENDFESEYKIIQPIDQYYVCCINDCKTFLNRNGLLSFIRNNKIKNMLC